MRKFKQITATLLCILSFLIMCFGTITASAASSVNVNMISSANKAEPGDTFTISYSFTNASDYKYGITAFTGYLKFDQSKVKCKKIVYGDFPNTILASNKSLDGEVRTLYTYANTSKKPGINNSNVFVSYVFTVLDGAKGKVKFTLDFDNIVTTDYDKSKPDNIILDFNKPSVTVNIINNQYNATSDQNDASADKPDNENPTNAPDKITTVKDEYLNPDYTQSDMANGESETFAVESGNSSDLKNSIEDKLGISSYQSRIDDIGKGNGTSSNSTTIILIIVAAVIVCVAVVIIVLINKKSTDQ